MAYNSASTRQNAALVLAMAEVVDKFTGLDQAIGTLATMAQGQGISVGLQAVGADDLPGIETPANLILDAVVALGALRTTLTTYSAPNRAALTTFRDQLGVRALAPKRCGC